MEDYILDAIIEKIKDGYLESDTFRTFLKERLINIDVVEDNIENTLENIFTNTSSLAFRFYNEILVNNSSNAVALLSYDDELNNEHFLQCNSVFLKKINSQTQNDFTKNDILNLSLTKLFEQLGAVSKERKNKLLDIVRTAIDSNKNVNYVEYLELQGKKSYWETTIKFIQSDDISYIIYLSQDISDKKYLENNLKRFRKALNHIRDSIIISDAETARIVDVNDSACLNLAYTREEFIGKSVGDVEISFPLHSKKEWLEYIENIKKSPNQSYIREGLQQRKNGDSFPVEVSIKYESFQDRDYLIAVSRDISEQNKIQKEIQANRERYYNIFNSVSDVILIHDSDTGDIVDTNKKATDLFGYTLNEIKTGGLKLLGDSSSLFKAENIIQSIKLASKGKEQVFEWKVKDIKNNSYWLEMSLKNTEIMGKPRVLSVCRNISSRKRIENRLSKLSARLLRQNKSLENKEQELVKYNRKLKNKQKELENTLKELSARNFELDQLVYKISHDLRSPLSSILGLVDIIQNEQSLGEQLKYLNYIENRVRKLDGFIKAMLNYAKANRSEIQKTSINFDKIIATCISDLEYLENFELMHTELNIQGKQYEFWSDELRINIIFNNIISNAYKYMNLRAEQSFLKIYIDFGNRGLHICFEDNGIGIPEEFLDKIFDMFFRATNKSEGSGLGMYIVKQTIEKLQGTIKLESKVNRGTKLFIFLPK